jgi:23S rRNA (cytosine1962-C5)-methyltransferase
LFSSDYQLIDAGAGRKLERFGAHVLDRPAPAAVSARRDPALWEQAVARFERGAGGQGQWTFARTVAPVWAMRCGHLTFELKFAKYGQVGLFPEQMDEWAWIAQQTCAASGTPRILNLFAHTGGSTLAAAAAGAEVTHVDAASSAVAWARRNAEASDLADRPIRWITEDAVKFARRELRRGRKYDAVILDPPSYGHGPHGESWKLQERLAELVELCLDLLSRDRLFVLLTSHSGELATATGLLKGVLTAAPRLRDGGTLSASDMILTAKSGARLHSGACVRWTAQGAAAHTAPRRQPHRSTRDR